MNNAASLNDMTPKESVFAEKAFAHMESYAVLPIPENYAVWYHYAAGSNEDLVREIEHAIAHKVPFSNETCGYLYNKFILSPANPQQKSVDDATDNAQKILADMIKIAGGITGETKNYNKNLDVYMHQIGKHIEHSDVRAIFKDLVASTASFKENSEASAKKLEESTKEIETLRKNLEQVTAASQRDFLTGVYNRKTFEQFFDEQLTVSREQKNDLCLLMLDIDHFKKFNDTYGHLLGDEVLKIVAHSLTNTLKGRDIVARFGGEEFIIMLPETSLDIAVKVADMIRGNIVSKEIKKRNTGETYGTITVSIGVARLRAETDTLPSLIKRADEALYRSKRDGRNRVTREA